MSRRRRGCSTSRPDQKPLDVDALRRLILEHGTNRSAAAAR